METGIPGVYAAGDVVTYPAKFKLIVTGAAEAVTAVNHAVTYYDPKARLDAGPLDQHHGEAEKAEAGARPTTDRRSGDRKLLDNGAGDLQPSMVGVVRDGASIGQDELRPPVCASASFASASICSSGPWKRAELVPAAHEAFARLDAGFTQARSGDAIGPAEHLDQVVQYLVEHQVFLTMDVQDVQPAARRPAQRDQVVWPPELPVLLLGHDGAGAACRAKKMPSAPASMTSRICAARFSAMVASASWITTGCSRRCARN